MKIIGEIKIKSEVMVEICQGTLIAGRINKINEKTIEIVTPMGVITLDKE